MHYAAWGGDIDAIRALKGAGEDVSLEDEFGRTPAHYAACGGHLSAIQELKKEGADIFARDWRGMTPVLFAAGFGKLDVVKWLVEKDKSCVVSIFFEAGRNKRTDIMKWLIETELVDVNVKMKYDYTPLHLAARTGDLDLVQLLLEREARVEEKADMGYTALLFAAENGHLDVIKELVAANADVNAKLEQGSTILHRAAAGGDLHVVRWLVEVLKVDVNVKYGDGVTASELANFFGNLDVFDYLHHRAMSASG